MIIAHPDVSNLLRSVVATSDQVRILTSTYAHLDLAAVHLFTVSFKDLVKPLQQVPVQGAQPTLFLAIHTFDEVHRRLPARLTAILAYLTSMSHQPPAAFAARACLTFRGG